ncbi:Type cbb3 cytochrome oxidase biogenesis protein CcoI, Copper-translocating P-type ATPase [Pseudohaliea rubra DSM 19751]|uniref:Type cbb3 cytochrome oxidase biogenesis protein CcoI, Copper-translocating P-type ATPase n=2 Tax=Pseudohaliea TaxID=1341120 RepID=A0A095XUG2_9GAMM|nr:Type cbb3 cytochrome oxidase biogenesis protein CcoI, Copper-translocating P-type ATPase [Pseudohaliea rubra DSM 19751]
MCCPGCRAVASLIAESGLARFYEQRTAYSERPPELPATALDSWRIYDDPELAATFSETGEDGLLRARLLLGGMTCAACTWLVESTLRRLPGLEAANVNLAQARLDVTLDPAHLSLAEVFARVSAMGYRAAPFRSDAQQQALSREHRTDLRRLAVAGVGMMQVGMFAIALHAGEVQGIASEYRGLLRWVSLLVAGFVVLFSARPFFTSAWRHLRQGALVMDLPVALAIELAFVASVYATLTASGEVYFDSVVMFTFFLLLARFAEKRLRHRDAFLWNDAEAALPAAVRVRSGDAVTQVPRQRLAAGDRVLVPAGDTVAIDGEIVAGISAVREDTFNGEPLPRTVTVGDTVFAGTVNIEEGLEVLASGSYRDSRLAALQRSIEAAATEKPRIAQLADRIAAWFIGAVLLATAATALVWWTLAPEKAFWIALSVLVISCPCALALATPAALANGAAALRRAGVIVRGENALEAVARATDLVFDKTGTLTAGRLAIDEVQVLGELPAQEVLALGAALQAWSTHPLADAFAGVDAAGGVSAVRYHVGAGLAGDWRGRRWHLGSLAHCRSLWPAMPAPPVDGRYWIALCSDSNAAALIALEDPLRPAVAGVLADARSRGLRLSLLTGDASGHGARLGAELAFDDVRTGLTPTEKSVAVSARQRAGAVVIMVGDGLNDAPVLKVADASLAVAGATDLARTQADFVVADGDLDRVSLLLAHAAKCRRIIRQNLAWALGYNALGIPLAALGYVPPWAAAIGMSLSSLLVVGNSLRLARCGRP